MEEIGEASAAAGETEPSTSDGLGSNESTAASVLAESCELFDCCICLDLIYKPVVLSCGHISCFWCIHHAMNGVIESNCPICRKPYKYFPAICQLLHNLLWKLKTTDYKQREEEVFEMERERNCFSPQFIHDVPGCASPSEEGATSLQRSLPSAPTNENPPQDNTSGETPGEVSIDDLLCAGCQKLLFRPSVLNCGHAYCELCMVSRRKERLKCQVCGTMHPGDPPLVCLSLNFFLEKRFPREFAARTASFQASLPSTAAEAGQPVSLSGPEEPPAAREPILIHYRVGCDYCGMYPIVGLRYKCTDCREEMGFDLCEGCYEARYNLPARFNQCHTPDHSFVLDESKMLVVRRAGPAAYFRSPSRRDTPDSSAF